MREPSFEPAPADYGKDEADMVRYRAAGAERAAALPNRGPLELEDDGALEAGIRAAYARYGFYVFTGLIDRAELDALEADVAFMLRRAPVARGASVDREGRPALDAGCAHSAFHFVRPLSDPLGGTDLAQGRHPAKMIEPKPPRDAPERSIQLINAPMRFSEACLRLYGHPGLLAVAADILGADFAPFNETVWIKPPGLGSSTAWHQDGWTHWESPDLDADTHGFNFMVQVSGCDAANGLWVVPGSHVCGKADIKAMVERAGSDRLEEAVPLVCDPGDVAIVNRQAIHGAFANTSPNLRLSIHFGFHRRRSVLGVRSGGVHNAVAVYDAKRIHERSKLIQYAIDARREHRPEERSFRYAPLADEEASLRFTDRTLESLRDYCLLDLGI